MVRCWLGLHSWGLMKISRLFPSVVYGVRCARCGKIWRA